MKKNYIILSVALLSLPLNSCNDTRVIDIDNITWKDDYFNILATSNQLQNQNKNNNNKKDYYSSITICDTKYSCFIGIGNGNFSVILYDSDSIVHFYGDNEIFIYGHYELQKEKKFEYKYSLYFNLINGGAIL